MMFSCRQMNEKSIRKQDEYTVVDITTQKKKACSTRVFIYNSSKTYFYLIRNYLKNFFFNVVLIFLSFLVVALCYSVFNESVIQWGVQLGLFCYSF